MNSELWGHLRTGAYAVAAALAVVAVFAHAQAAAIDPNACVNQTGAFCEVERFAKADLVAALDGLAATLAWSALMVLAAGVVFHVFAWRLSPREGRASVRPVT